jgi:hypothetical protein
VDDIVLSHVVERNEDLDGEPLDQAEREALEVVHLDEVVKVDTQQLERDTKMLAEGERIEALYDVLLVLRIVLIQCFDEPRLNKTLLEESLLILENFEGHELFLFVVENTEDDTE